MAFPFSLNPSEGWKVSVVVNDDAIVFDFENDNLKSCLIGHCIIDRKQGRLTKPNNTNLRPALRYSAVCILGALKLCAGYYLVIVNSSVVVGKIFNSEVHKITSVSLLPISKRNLDDSEEIHAEKAYVAMIQKLLGDGSFYFSFGYDLTSSCQRKFTTDGKQNQEPRFDWGLPMREHFKKILKIDHSQPPDANAILKWCQPIIRGFVSITSDFKIGSTTVDFILISRKSRERPGRRYTKRGANKKGHVANYVESEQIIVSPKSSNPAFPGITDSSNTKYSGIITSFVQIRGSIPLLWEQRLNLSWEPPIRMKPHPPSVQQDVLRAHFHDQLGYYQRLTSVSLVKLKGGESELTRNYTKYMDSEKNDKLGYVYFDLQSEVGHTKFQNLGKLFSQTDEKLDDYGFFAMDCNSTKTRNQSGTMRTNCKDNLDRTNLVQSMFAFNVGHKQLQSFTDKNLQPSEKNAFDTLMRIAWADNGDALSIQYAGTPAMRSDHTRTGKTTLRGQYNDAKGAITRYYINNFEDGRIQDAIDLVIDKSKVPSSYKVSENYYRKTNAFISLLTTFFVFIFKILQPSRNLPFGTLLCVLWMTCVFFVWKVFRLDPNRIVDLPRLRTPKNPPPGSKSAASGGVVGVTLSSSSSPTKIKIQ